MSLTIRTVLCALSGGHWVRGPVVRDGRVRLECGYQCGWQSEGVETVGQARVRERQARRVVGFAPVQRGTSRRIA